MVGTNYRIGVKKIDARGRPKNGPLRDLLDKLGYNSLAETVAKT